MGGPSEHEYREKLNKIRENMNKGVKDTRDKLSKIDEIKLDALKKLDESRRSMEHGIDKVEDDVMKSKDMAPESRERLRSEIAALKREIDVRYTDLRKRVSETNVPT